MDMRTRAPETGAVRHEIPFPEAGVRHLLYEWVDHIDAGLERRMIELMRVTTASAPIIGFAEHISDEQAAGYMQDLRANLAAGRCELLSIATDTGLLIGLCTMRRNLNPNNRHLADLAKGMIREEFRGGAVLPAAFLEIAARCRQVGVEVLTLDVRADTPAHRAWQRFGFQTWGVLQDYARSAGQVLAGHFMMQPVAELEQRARQMMVQRTAQAA